MPVYQQEIEVLTTGGTDVIDVTHLAAAELEHIPLKRGTMTLFIPGSTASLTTIEFESGAVADLKRALERLAPRDMEYEHNRRWHDGNGFAHVRAALLGPSLQVPFQDGRLALGTWQQIVLLDFDNRPRKRRILVQCTGD